MRVTAMGGTAVFLLWVDLSGHSVTSPWSGLGNDRNMDILSRLGNNCSVSLRSSSLLDFCLRHCDHLLSWAFNCWSLRFTSASVL